VRLLHRQMSNKSKGSNAERELYQMFIDNCFRAVRVAGSGVMENTSCDLIAGKPGKKYAIECKSCKDQAKYITKMQIEELVIFSEIFGLIPVVAVRFNHQGWFFLSPKELEGSGKNWVVSLEFAKEKGKRFSQMFGEEKRADIENYEELMKEN